MTSTICAQQTMQIRLLPATYNFLTKNENGMLFFNFKLFKNIYHIFYFAYITIYNTVKP